MGKHITDEELLNAIMSTGTQKEASELLGISEQTVCNRIQKESFKTLLFTYRRDLFDVTSNRIVSSSKKALETLVALLDSDSEMVRYNTATKILSLGQQYVASQDILKRIDNVERSMNENFE